MGGVQFEDFHPGLARHPRAGDELGGDGSDFGDAQRLRGGVAIAERDCAGADRLPAAIFHRDRLVATPRHINARLAPGMADLHAWHGPAFGDDRGQARQQMLVRGVPQAKAMRRDAARGGHMHNFGEDDPCPASRPRAEMLDVPVIAQPVTCGILTHRRHRDPVARGDGSEGDGFEKFGICHGWNR